MKPRFSHQTHHAMTLVEVLMIIAVLVVVVALLLPALLSHGEGHAWPINCVNNLKGVGLAFRVWEGDNGDKCPMFVSVTNGGAMELVATGNVALCFQVMSNELSTPKILHCPDDRVNVASNLFVGLTSSDISYFLGADVTNQTNPQMILSGDDNFEIDGIPVKSGLLEISRNTPIA